MEKNKLYKPSGFFNKLQNSTLHMNLIFIIKNSSFTGFGIQNSCNSFTKKQGRPQSIERRLYWLLNTF